MTDLFITPKAKRRFFSTSVCVISVVFTDSKVFFIGSKQANVKPDGERLRPSMDTAISVWQPRYYILKLLF